MWGGGNPGEEEEEDGDGDWDGDWGVRKAPLRSRRGGGGSHGVFLLSVQESSSGTRTGSPGSRFAAVPGRAASAPAAPTTGASKSGTPRPWLRWRGTACTRWVFSGLAQKAG